MSQLGPVIGNRLANGHKAALNPHLRVQLALESSRSTPLGTIATGSGGRLSFAPNYVQQRASDKMQAKAPPTSSRPYFQAGQRVRVTARFAELLAQEVFPFEPDEAAAVAGREGLVAKCEAIEVLGLVVVELGGVPWSFMPGFLVLACPAEGDDELAAMAGEGTATASDPYTEPLALGDTVHGMDGRIGRVTLVEPQRLGVVFERRSAWCGDMNWRVSFRLLAKAGAWGRSNG
jgi:hypothetical protein